MGRFNFDEVRYEYYRDVSVQFEAFKAGEIDLRQENIARNWATAYDIPAVRDGRIQRGQVVLLEAFGAGFTWGSVLIRY